MTIDILCVRLSLVKERGEIYMNNLVNLTPHVINLLTNTGEVVAIEPISKDKPARVTATLKDCGVFEANGLIFNHTEQAFGDIINLPDEQKGMYFIVSRIVADAAPKRKDLVIVNDLVRDEQGLVRHARSISFINL